METSYLISPNALNRFNELRYRAIDQITEDFYRKHGAEYARFGERGRKFCREDIEFHLDFLRPVLEMGQLQPYVDYLRWFAEVLAARNIPVDHVAETIDAIGAFFRENIEGEAGEVIATALTSAASEAQQAGALSVSDPVMDPWPEQKPFEEALLLGDRQTAAGIFNSLLQGGHSLLDLEVKLIQSALVDIGLQWQANKISVAQEHLATATAQTIMANAFSKTRLKLPNGKKAVLACVEGNDHALGIRMIGDALEVDGWEVQFLGANVPVTSLVEFVKNTNPNLVGLSISLPHQMAAARQTIQALRAQISHNPPPVIVGGYAVNQFEVLAYRMGADGHARNALLALPLAIKFCGAS